MRTDAQRRAGHKYYVAHKAAVIARSAAYAKTPIGAAKRRKYRADTRTGRAAYHRKRRLAREFGITPEQYDTMLHQQAGVCALCGWPPKAYRLSVDHDHHTGRVRGLLCWYCNHRLLGSRVTASMLRKAANYMESAFDGRML